MIGLVHTPWKAIVLACWVRISGKLSLPWNTVFFQNEAVCPCWPSCFRKQMLVLRSELQWSLTRSEKESWPKCSKWADFEAPSFLPKPRYCIKGSGLSEFQRNDSRGSWDISTCLRETSGHPGCGGGPWDLPVSSQDYCPYSSRGFPGQDPLWLFIQAGANQLCLLIPTSGKGGEVKWFPSWLYSTVLGDASRALGRLHKHSATELRLSPVASIWNTILQVKR